MGKSGSRKQKGTRPSKNWKELILENNRLIQRIQREQQENLKDLRRRMRRIKELISPDETARFKSKVIRFK